ncbi:MAG TPA: GspH/FimT family pseudopilin [Dokdonella sp.]|nr:GspH/FimT family pseudopilin [Dokdonella sp.]
MHDSPGRTRGHTLVELVITLAIVATLVTIALPAFGRLIGRTRSQVARSDLEFSLNQARLAAASRNLHVVACPSRDFDDCEPTTRWHPGWLVFADSDHDGHRGPDEPVIATNQAREEGVGILATLGRLRIDYRPDGSAAGTNVTLTVCDRAAQAADASTIVVGPSGRVRHGRATPAAAAACLAAAQ